MSFRYDNRGKFKNFTVGMSRAAKAAKGQSRGQNRTEIIQYTSPRTRYPNDNDFDFITTRTHVWHYHDKFFKLAATFYGDPGLWWIIPWFNQKPLESDYRVGDVIEIPLPVDELYRFFG